MGATYIVIPSYVTIEPEPYYDKAMTAARRALELAGDGDLVLGTGSLSVAAEVIEEMRGIEPELYPYIKRPADTGAMSTV